MKSYRFIPDSFRELNSFPKAIVFTFILAVSFSCTDDSDGPGQEHEQVLASVSYSAENYIPHYSDKDSIVYNSDNSIHSFIQTDINGDNPLTTYVYTRESNGNITVRKSGSETIVFTETPETDSVRIRHYSEYSSTINKPTYVKFFNGRLKSVYEQWEYTGGEESFDMETDGKCLKRIIVSKDAAGNVTQVDSYGATTGDLQLIERYTAFTYTDLANPFKGYYLEPRYMEITYNKLPTAFEQSGNLFDYYERHVYNSSGNAIISQYYTVEYSVDERKRVIGSRVSMNGDDFLDDITSITYITK